MRCKAAFLLLVLWGVSVALLAQQPTPLTPAQADSLGLEAHVSLLPTRIDLGRPYTATVVVQYPSTWTLALPDSLTGYPGWEWIAQQHAHARSGARQTDSLEVQLRTWEIDPVQYLRPRFWLVRGSDSLLWQPAPDSAAFAARIPVFNPGLPLRPDLTLLPIRTPVDWALWAWLGVAVVAVLGVAAALLYRPFLRWRARRHLQRQFEDLKATLALHYQRVELSPIEGLNGLNEAWKRWLEDDWKRPLRSLTPREFSRVVTQREDLSPEMRTLLYDWVQVEERINYAGEPLRTAWLHKAYPELLRMLESGYAERLAAIR